MPNPFQAVTFQVGIDTYTLSLGFRAICSIEEQFDMSFTAFAKQLSGGDVRVGRLVAVFRAMLSGAHPEMTDDRAMALMEEIGSQRAGELIGEAMKQSPVLRPRTEDAPAKGRRRVA